MASYRLQDDAIDDLDRLYEYGILTFGLTQADRYYDQLLIRFQEIAMFPLRCPSVAHIRTGYRRCVHGVHSIYYRLEGDDVVIVRVLGRQDFERML